MWIYWDEDYNAGEIACEAGRLDAAEAPDVDVVTYFERNGGTDAN